MQTSEVIDLSDVSPELIESAQSALDGIKFYFEELERDLPWLVSKNHEYFTRLTKRIVEFDDILLRFASIGLDRQAQVSHELIEVMAEFEAFITIMLAEPDDRYMN